MKQETNGARRKGMWIAAAATVLTVAFGVTAGGLLGYGGSNGSAVGTAPTDVAGSPAIAANPTAAEPAVTDASPAAPGAATDAPAVLEEPQREEPRHGRREHEEHERGEHQGRGERGEHGDHDDD